MRISLTIALSSLLALTSASTLAESNWVTMEGKRIPESGAVKSRDGFNAMLLITSDPNWHDEWNTPSSHIPHFNESHKAKTGGELHILSFFSNPLLDQDGFANISCDFSVIRPDGSLSVNEKNFECFKTRLETDPANLYLSTASLKFVSEETDPKGVWKVEVVMRDLNRGVELTLKDSFVNE
jgi:hypothetical protein